jgi:hypothetical protein
MRTDPDRRQVRIEQPTWRRSCTGILSGSASRCTSSRRWSASGGTTSRPPSPTGGGRELCARYLVGGDDADSTVRELVGFGAGTDTTPGRMAVVGMVDQEKLRPGFHHPPNGTYVHLVRPPGLSGVLTVVSGSLGTNSASDKRCNPYVGGL